MEAGRREQRGAAARVDAAPDETLSTAGCGTIVVTHTGYLAFADVAHCASGHRRLFARSLKPVRCCSVLAAWPSWLPQREYVATQSGSGGLAGPASATESRVWFSAPLAAQPQRSRPCDCEHVRRQSCSRPPAHACHVRRSLCGKDSPHAPQDISACWRHGSPTAGY
jgi:hypothetical protein